ncbi:methyltransferase domain-containing protein [Burkholderia plantarii]|uniref:methyltransferase domain-containing protein n=1 Tax=Burkholderia plantarii TaxID=41899 RepID=UPI0018DDC4D8|nr:class I SAM-dependent methyltransferase [Burkholderia plantarii]MBI0328743.1 class I SAM-dependent methyltransferase [Burkholderia plantarii]
MSDILSLVVLMVVVALCLSLLLFQILTGVPPMSSGSAETADVVALLKQATLPPRAIVYELGSGWGALVIALAQAFPDAEIRGIEASPLPYWVARWRTRRLPNVSLRRRDFHRCDLSDAHAVTCYLMMAPMPKLAALLDRMLRPGTPVVALTFWFRGRQVEAVRQGPGLRGAAALYRWPARKPVRPDDGAAR